MKLEKYSIGIGDRFGHQGRAQLDAIIKAKEDGVDIAPVWNKSYREHGIAGTNPADVRTEADTAVKARGWVGSYYVGSLFISAKSRTLVVCMETGQVNLPESISFSGIFFQPSGLESSTTPSADTEPLNVMPIPITFSCLISCLLKRPLRLISKS